jgi:hypothetical protein
MGSVVSLKVLASGDDTEIVDRPVITFDDAWASYPRKVAKKDAMKAWAQIKPEWHTTIIEAIGRSRRTDQWRKDGGAFIPYFATWLRGERWNDEFDVEVDLTMGQCCWNQHGTRENGPRCALPATKEKNGVVYCAAHAGRVN